MDSELITTILAIWGAVLGTIGTIISIILAAREIHKDQRILKVQISLTAENPFWVVAGSDNAADNSLPKHIVVNVYNNGFRSIHIKKIYLKMLEGESIDNCKFIKKSLPFNLDENQAVDAFFDIGDVFPTIRSSKDHLSKVFVIDMNGKKWNFNIPKSITTEILAST